MLQDGSDETVTPAHENGLMDEDSPMTLCNQGTSQAVPRCQVFRYHQPKRASPGKWSNPSQQWVRRDPNEQPEPFFYDLITRIANWYCRRPALYRTQFENRSSIARRAVKLPAFNTTNFIQANLSATTQWQVAFASLSTISRTFNSLFKVLFTFRSRYLFTIGLPVIFSFRRDVPPIFRLQYQTTLLTNLIILLF